MPTFEELIAELSAKFIALPAEAINANLERELSRVADFLGLDRITLFEFTGGQAQLAVVLSCGNTERDPRPQLVNPRDFPWWADQLMKGEVIAISHPSELPAEAPRLKEAMQKKGILSSATIPLAVGGRIIGCMTFVSRKRIVRWTGEFLLQLKLLTQIFANALKRQRDTEALAATEALEASILASLESHIAVLDGKGTILAVNDAWVRFAKENAGAPSVASPGQNYIEVCRKAGPQCPDGDKVAEGIRAVLDRRVGRFQHEYECHAPDEERWFLMTVTPLSSSSGGAVVAHENITEWKKAERVLRESEERFRLLADNAPVMIWMTGTDKGCTYFNKRGLAFVGRDLQSLLGEGWIATIHPEDLQKLLDTYSTAFERRETFSIEYRMRRFDGVYRWVLATGLPRFDPDSSFGGYIGSAMDVTVTKQAERTLAAFSRGLIEAQERERSRIARELHDDVVQRLALLASGIEQVRQHSPKVVDEKRRLAELAAAASDISLDIQALSHQLHPPKLEYLGVVAAMKSYCREMAEQRHVNIDFSAAKVPPGVSQDASLCLFRVLQEALRNGMQHGGATRFTVRLTAERGQLHLYVRDFGSGFDVRAAEGKRGLGLASMRERVHMVNGGIAIMSKPGQGTEIAVRVPLHAASAERPEAAA